MCCGTAIHLERNDLINEHLKGKRARRRISETVNEKARRRSLNLTGETLYIRARRLYCALHLNTTTLCATVGLAKIIEGVFDFV